MAARREPQAVPAAYRDKASLVGAAAMRVVAIGGSVARAFARARVENAAWAGLSYSAAVAGRVKSLKDSGLDQVIKEALPPPPPPPEKPIEERRQLWLEEASKEWAAVLADGGSRGLKKIVGRCNVLYGADAAWAIKSVKTYAESMANGEFALKSPGPTQSYPKEGEALIVALVKKMRDMKLPVYKELVLERAGALIEGTVHAPHFAQLDDSGA